MKKIYSIILAFVFIMLSVFSANAETSTYYISDLNISIDLPDDYYVFTRDMDENSPVLEKFGYTKDYIVNSLTKGDLYLSAFTDSSNEDINISSREVEISDICIFDDDELEDLADSISKSYKKDGLDVLDCEVYVNTKSTFIVTKFFHPKHGNALDFYTINNYDIIQFTFWTYDKEVSESRQNFFTSIIDGIVFHAYSGLTATESIEAPQTSSDDVTNEADNSDANSSETDINVAIILIITAVSIFIASGIVVIAVLTKSNKPNRNTAIADITAKTESQIRYCTNCGNHISSADVFCSKCGTLVNREITSEKV